MACIVALHEGEEVEVVTGLGVVDYDVDFVHDLATVELELLSVASVLEVLSLRILSEPVFPEVGGVVNHGL